MNKIFNFQFSIFNKIKFFLRKPKVVIVAGQSRQTAKEAIFQVLKRYFKPGKDIFIFEAEEKEINKFSFFLKNSELPILAITGLNEDSSVAEPSEAKKRTKFSLPPKNLPTNTHFVLNYDDEKTKEINNLDNFKIMKFGFSEKNDIFASDIKENGGTNFKINHKGSTVPFWFKKALDKEQINIILSVVSVGIILGLNLIEISQALKEN